MIRFLRTVGAAGLALLTLFCAGALWDIYRLGVQRSDLTAEIASSRAGALLLYTPVLLGMGLVCAWAMSRILAEHPGSSTRLLRRVGAAGFALLTLLGAAALWDLYLPFVQRFEMTREIASSLTGAFLLFTPILFVTTCIAAWSIKGILGEPSPTRRTGSSSA